MEAKCHTQMPDIASKWWAQDSPTSLLPKCPANHTTSSWVTYIQIPGCVGPKGSDEKGAS